MKNFNNPLDNISVASPCPANWDEMFGDDRKRFCADCKLNVYNLSDMTRREAENLLINSEGRLCVRFYRRSDGTVLTKNCPVGWQAVKRRVSRFATAVSSIVLGFLSGIFAVRTTEFSISYLPLGDVPSPVVEFEKPDGEPIVGEIETLRDVRGLVDVTDFRRAKVRDKGTPRDEVLGRVVPIEDIHKKKVVAWIE